MISTTWISTCTGGRSRLPAGGIEPDPADEERAEALLAALQKMRTAIAEERMRTTGRYIHEYHVARDALLQALARKPPSSEEQLRNAAENGTFGDLTNAVFIKKYARAICVTLENALAVLSGDEPPHPPPFAPPPNGDGTQPPGSGDGGGWSAGIGDVAGAGRPPPGGSERDRAPSRTSSTNTNTSTSVRDTNERTAHLVTFT